MPSQYGQDALLGLTLGSNLLALPATYENAYQQTLRNRQLADQLSQVPAGNDPLNAAIQQAVQSGLVPTQMPFGAEGIHSAMQVPVLGSVLKGIGGLGSVLQTVLGNNEPAPRPPITDLLRLASERQTAQRDQERLGMEQQRLGMEGQRLTLDEREKNSLIQHRQFVDQKTTASKSIYADEPTPSPKPPSTDGTDTGRTSPLSWGLPRPPTMADYQQLTKDADAAVRAGTMTREAADASLFAIKDAAQRGTMPGEPGGAAEATGGGIAQPGRYLNQNALKMVPPSVRAILMAKPGVNLNRFRSEDLQAAIDEERLTKKTQKLPQGFGKIAQDVADVRETVRMMDDLRATVDQTPNGRARLRQILHDYTPPEGGQTPIGPVVGRWNAGLYGKGFATDPLAVKVNTLAQRISLMGASTIMRRSGTRAYQALSQMQQHFSQPYDNDVEFLTKLDTNRTSLLNGAEEAVTAATQDPASMLRELQGMETQPYGGRIAQPTATGTEGAAGGSDDWHKMLDSLGVPR